MNKTYKGCWVLLMFISDLEKASLLNNKKLVENLL